MVAQLSLLTSQLLSFLMVGSDGVGKTGEGKERAAVGPAATGHRHHLL